MTIGNLGALKQKKRQANAGVLVHRARRISAGRLHGISLPNGIAAACFYTAAYSAMNVGAFAVVTQISGYHEHTRTIEDFTGVVGLRRPWLAGLLAFFLLSMIGIPFTGGFFAKFYVYSPPPYPGGHTVLAVVRPAELRPRLLLLPAAAGGNVCAAPA